MIITLKRPDTCSDCGAPLPEGSQARWYRNGKVYGLACHENGKETARKKVAAKAPVQDEWLPRLREANEAAKKAQADYAAKYYQTPNFVVQEHKNPADDKSPVVKSYPLTDLCGFVWLELRQQDAKALIAHFRKHGQKSTRHGDRDYTLGEFTLHHNTYRSAWSYPWTLNAPAISYANGGISAMEAAAGAFSETMGKYGVAVHVRSRLD